MLACKFIYCVQIMDNRFKGGLARAASLTEEERIASAKKAAAARWGRKAFHKGSFLQDFNIDADCYVLDDEAGTAVVTQSGMARVLGFQEVRGGKSLMRLISRETVAKYLGAETAEKIKNPFRFQYIDRGAKDKNIPPFSGFGYDATVIIDLCSAIIQAGRHDSSIRQEQIVAASVVIAACAKTGIRELIYKLAGYNSTKAQVIAAFKLYVQQEASKWAKEFPDDLYAEWQRIYNIPVPVKGRNWEHKHLTLKHIYIPLAKSNGRLLDMLRQAKGDQRSAKLHQFLTEVGKNTLRTHIWKVVGIASGSRNREEYERGIANAFGGQLPLGFEDIP